MGDGLRGRWRAMEKQEQRRRTDNADWSRLYLHNYDGVTDLITPSFLVSFNGNSSYHWWMFAVSSISMIDVDMFYPWFITTCLVIRQCVTNVPGNNIQLISGGEAIQLTSCLQSCVAMGCKSRTRCNVSLTIIDCLIWCWTVNTNILCPIARRHENGDSDLRSRSKGY